MGIINHDCVIATSWDNSSVLELDRLAKAANIGPLVITERNQFGDQTVMLPPDGSKEGWPDSGEGDNMRDAFVKLIKTFDYEDGSNPFKWVEVSFGEQGQKITRGNNRNCY